MTKRTATESSDLQREEWDFSKVPRNQLAACFVHEYGRELTKQWPRLLQLLTALRHYSKLPKGHPNGWKEIRTHLFLGKIFSRRFGHSPAFCFFPDTTWQSIDAKQRLEWVELFYHKLHVRPSQSLTIQRLRALEPANEMSLEAFAYVHELLSDEELDQTEYGFFAVNWNYPDREIKSAFELWLKEQREERVKRGLTEIKHHKTARGGFRDKLRWLGALRVINHYPPGQLADLPVKVVDNPSWRLKVPAPYSYLSDLYEAAKKAQRLIDGMRARPAKPVKGKSLQGKLEWIRRLAFPTDSK